MKKDRKIANYFDGYTINLVQDKEGDWLAHFVEMPNMSAFGETPPQAIEELRVAWELMKESYKADGEVIPQAPSCKNYSGAFNVRVDKRLHKALAIEAAQNGLSLNALIAQKLARATLR